MEGRNSGVEDARGSMHREGSVSKGSAGKDSVSKGSVGKDSVVAGAAVCWLLNVAQVGIGWLMLVADDRTLPAVFVLVGMIGLVQVGYVAPIWRVLRRKGKPRTARGLLVAAGITLLVNAAAWMTGTKLH
jgi:hypothetical protein